MLKEKSFQNKIIDKADSDSFENVLKTFAYEWKQDWSWLCLIDRNGHSQQQQQQQQQTLPLLIWNAELVSIIKFKQNTVISFYTMS